MILGFAAIGAAAAGCSLPTEPAVGPLAADAAPAEADDAGADGGGTVDDGGAIVAMYGSPGDTCEVGPVGALSAPGGAAAAAAGAAALLLARRRRRTDAKK